MLTHASTLVALFIFVKGFMKILLHSPEEKLVVRTRVPIVLVTSTRLQTLAVI
ncbi:hypothetical protein Cal7507_0434 [Calothrix sp. PCC 7507]|nr:hypothetical protein Cal7507_0434 [Calothrix sp. PCC 7507]